MRFVRLDKGDFIGREALRRGMTEPLRWQCVYLGIDASDADCLGSEAVFDGETRVGAISSGGYGHTVGRSLAFAYVAPPAAAAGTPLAVMVLGERRPATVLAEALCDPHGLRARADA